MGRALRSGVIAVRNLAGPLDLWLCMWEAGVQERFETAVVRAMTDANPRATRLHALALCWIIGTPRLLAAAQRLADTGIFAATELQSIAVVVSPLRDLLDGGRRLHGNVLGVELLL